MVVFSHYPSDPRVRREAEALDKAGIAVDVICLRADGEKKAHRYGNVRVHRILQGSDRKEGLLKYLACSAVFCAAAFIRLCALSARNRYGLIQAHNMPDFLVFAGVFHKALGRPVVLDMHDLTVELFISRSSKRWFLKLTPAVKLLEKFSCLFADKIITTSAGFKNRLMERGISPEKISLVLNSADDSLFTPQGRRPWVDLSNGPKLLYHGTVARRFGLHIAIEAVALLRNRMPDIRLCIFGKYDPEYKEELESIIKKHSLEDSVFLGAFIGIEEIRKNISEADIGIAPYASDEFMDLALSTKVFEYVAMGLPVVASGLVSIRSVFSEKSISYFTPGDPRDLCEKISAACKNPLARKHMSANALSEYERISWPEMSKKYLELIETLCVPE